MSRILEDVKINEIESDVSVYQYGCLDTNCPPESDPMPIAHILGFPRIGVRRELKTAVEAHAGRARWQQPRAGADRP